MLKDTMDSVVKKGAVVAALVGIAVIWLASLYVLAHFIKKFW